jgi:hypothetical protein
MKDTGHCSLEGVVVRVDRFWVVRPASRVRRSSGGQEELDGLVTIVRSDRIAMAGRQQQHDRNGSSRRTVGRVLGGASAALLFAAAIIQPQVANADDGGGSHHGFGHFRSVFGFGGIFPPPFWWVMAFPSFPFTTTGIPTIGITTTIPAPAITATIPTLATARSPTPGRLGTIAPSPLAITRL